MIWKSCLVFDFPLAITSEKDRSINPLAYTVSIGEQERGL